MVRYIVSKYGQPGKLKIETGSEYTNDRFFVVFDLLKNFYITSDN